MLLSKAILIICYIPCMSAACARDCYGPCPSDYCFMMGALSSTVPVYFSPNNYYNASQYCISLGCHLPTFMNAQELADVNAYRTCMGIPGTFIFLDYVMQTYTTTGWIVQPTNMRASSTLFNTNPPWAATEPNGNWGQPYMFLDTSGNIYDVEYNWNAWAIPTVCMCPVCPGTMCGGLTNGVINSPVVGNFQFPYRPGSQVTFSCNTGFFFGQSNSTCVQGSTPYPQWSSNPVCSVVYCPNMFATATTGSIAAATFSAVVQTYTFNCLPNYFDSSQNTSTPKYMCNQANPSMSVGIWTPATFTECTNTCPNLVNPVNGLVSMSFIANPIGLPSLGTVANYSCNVGYSLAGSNRSACTSYGNWSTVPPTCQPVYCPNIFATSTTGTIAAALFSAVVQTYTFNCLPTYFDLAQNTSTPKYICNQANPSMVVGTWTPATFTECKNTCPNLANPVNGLVSVSFIANPIGLPPLGTVANYSCNVGYTLVGSKTPICTSYGNWSTNPPTCQPVYCTNIFPANSTTGSMSYSIFTVAFANYPFNCYPNYVHLALNSTAPIFQCSLFNSTMTVGTWIPSTFTECTITCPSLVNPNNGTVNYPFNATPVNLPPSGTSAAYGCNVGFNLIGPSASVCLSNGTWSDIAPICQPNCSMTTWTDWSTCSQICGPGSQYRTRNITQPGLCFPLNETQNCTTVACSPPLVVVIIQNIGCSILLGLIGATFAVNTLLRVWHLERLIHACEEITLFIAHIFILSFRNSYDNTVLCTATAAVIQYCMMSCFTFFVLEAIQCYAYTTSVRSRGNFFPVWLNLVIGFGIPGLITGPSLALYYQEYPARISCWLNWGSKIAFGSAIPIMVSTCVVIIIVEAAGMGEHISLVNRNNVKYSANWFNRNGLLFVIGSCVVHWYVGFTAIYYGNVALYTAVFITFIIHGVMIFIHHCFCHYLVHVWLYKLYRKCCCKRGPLPKWVTNPNDGKHKKPFEGLKKAFKLIRKPQWKIDAEKQAAKDELEKSVVVEALPVTTTDPPVVEVAKTHKFETNVKSKMVMEIRKFEYGEEWLSGNSLFGQIPLPVKTYIYPTNLVAIQQVSTPPLQQPSSYRYYTN